jgi:ribosomal protein L31E
MDIKQFIQQSLEGKAVQAKETLNDLLSNRAFEALDAKKRNIASTLYGDGEDTEVQDTEEEEYTEEE